MGSLGEAVLDLTADPSKMDAGLGEGKEKVQGALGGLKSVFSTAAGTMLGMFSFQALQQIGQGVLSFGKDILNEAMEAEKGMAQLNAVIKSTGGVAGVTAEEATKLADSLSGLTMFEDDTVIAAESMLLTFTNIKDDVFPAATKTVLNMSTALGMDATNAAMMLGKALNDPIAGVSALRRVGVTLTDAQEKLVKSLVGVGNVAGAQKIILKELAVEFGGSAEAAGQTFAGQLKILQNEFGNVKEELGTSLMPGLLAFMQLISGELMPGIKEFASTLAINLGNAVKWAVYYFETVLLPALRGFWDWVDGTLFPMFEQMSEWLGVNIPDSMEDLLSGSGGVLADLAALFGVSEWALRQWLATLWWVVDSFVNGMDFLYEDGAGVLLGIFRLFGVSEETAMEWGRALWQATYDVRLGLKELGAASWTWLAVNIPLALRWLANMWITVLLPAVRAVFAWMIGTLFPFLRQLYTWLITNIPLALQWLANKWRTVLLPAIQAVWAWMNGTLFPLLRQLYDWLMENLPLALQWLADKWETVLLPAIRAAGEWMNSTLFPTLKEMYAWLMENLPLALQWLADKWETVLLPAIQAAWAWMNGTLFPLLKEMYNWLMVNIPQALKFLSDTWTTVLWPAIKAVWNWLNGTLFPFYKALGNFLVAVFTANLKIQAGIWQNVLYPAIHAVWSALSSLFMPILKALADFWKAILFPILQLMALWFGQELVRAFQDLSDMLKGVTEWLTTMADLLNNMKLPDWMTPGSPTPWETGLVGVNNALRMLTNAQLPELSMRLKAMPVPAMAYGMNLNGGGGAGGGRNLTNNVNIVNPSAEPASASVDKTLRKLSYLGVLK